MAFPYVWFILGFLVFPIAPMASAETIGPELFISSRGEVHIKNVELAVKNALNLFSLNVWGLKLLVTIDRFTVLESADGKPVSLGDIQLGHFLEVKGRAAGTKDGLLDTRLVRDLSIGTPPPPPQPAAVSSALAPPAPQPALPPPPTAAAGSATRRLIQQLRVGMRGGEVIVLQEFLQNGGWGIPDDGPVTGYFGKVTENAVRKFQAAHGVAPEGEVGPRTRAIINELLQKEPR